MNVVYPITVVLALLPGIALAAAAGPEPAPAPAVTGIAIDCARVVVPSQRAVSELLGIDNFGQAYRARERLMVNAMRDCQRPGMARLLLVREAVDLQPEPRRNPVAVAPGR